MGGGYSTQLVQDGPVWDEYVDQGWRSERCRELDRTGGLNRPPLKRGQSFNAKLQYLAEQVKKQGDVMQEVLLPAPAPKEEAKYTGFMLATERRALERQVFEAEEKAAAEAAARSTDDGAPAERKAPAPAAYKPGTVYAPAGPKQLPSPPPPVSRARKTPHHHHHAAAIVTTVPAPVPVASWRLRTWQARRRAMIIVLTVLRLRRGKKRNRLANRLGDLGFLIPKVLADDSARFVDEQRKYSNVKDELADAKHALDEMMCRNTTTLPPSHHHHHHHHGSGDDTSPAGSPMASRSNSMTGATMPSPGRPGAISAGRMALSSARNSDGGSPLRSRPGGGAAAAAAHSGWQPSTSRPSTSGLGAPSRASNSIADHASRPGHGDGPHANSNNSQGAPRRISTPNLDREASGNVSGRRMSAMAPAPATDPVSTPPSRAARTSLASGLPPSSPALPPQFNPATAGLSSMAARRFGVGSRPSTAAAAAPGLVTQGPAGPLAARTNITSAVAAKHAHIMAAQAQIDSESTALKKSGQMLSVYVNRANAAWTEGQQWGHADTWTPADVQAFAHSDQFQVYKADLVRRLRQGNLCMQLFAGEDFLVGNDKRPASGSAAAGGASLLHSAVAAFAGSAGSAGGGGGGGSGAGRGPPSRNESGASNASAASAGSSNGSGGAAVSSAAAGRSGPGRRQEDLWTSDPWQLIDQFRPGIMPHTDRIQGLTMGARIMCQLAISVQHVAGAEALEKLPVLLHINEEQLDQVVKELWSYSFFGLRRTNVILVAAPLHGGYRYDHEVRAFEREYDSPVAPLGSGFSLLQLSWPGEAFIIGPEGAPEPLENSAFAELTDRKVEWLIARRARDLVMLSQDSVLDVNMLSFCLMAKDRAGGGGAAGGGAGGAAGRSHMLVEVTACDNLVDARAMDSFVMRRTERPATGTGGIADAAAPSCNVELRQAELATPKMIEAINYLRAIRDGHVTVGLGRYMLHLPFLVNALVNASAFRPKLSLEEELVRVSLDLADLTAAPQARTLAVQAIATPGVLLSPDDLERVIPLLQAQDHDVTFRDTITANRQEAAQQLSFVSASPSAQSGCQAVVVFLVANRASTSAVSAAMALARPGRDVIHLVTCVSSELQKSDAQEMLKGHQKRLIKSMVETRVEVIVRGVWGLLDVMENYVNAVDARMVVMGSQHLTSNDFNYVIGSITLAAVKRFMVPVLVVTANSRQNLEPDRSHVRFLALVEPHSKNLINFACQRLLDAKRADRLLFAQVQATKQLTRQQLSNMRRLVDNFSLLTAGQGFPVNRVLALEGAMDSALVEAAGLHHIQVVAVALPTGTKALPPVLVNLLRSCRGATLVYKEPVGGRPGTPPAADGAGGGGGDGSSKRAGGGGFGPGSAGSAKAAAARMSGTNA